LFFNMYLSNKIYQEKMKKLFWLQIFMVGTLFTACTNISAQLTGLPTETSERYITQAVTPTEDQLSSTATILPYTLAKTPQAKTLQIINENNAS